MALTRRFALAASALALAGVVTIRPALDRLAAARREGDRLSDALAVDRAPPDPFGRLDPLSAGTPDMAQAMLTGLLRGIAIRHGVLVERAVPVAARQPAGIVAADLTISGDATHVLRFLEASENGTPLVRLARWRLRATGQALRLDARAVAPWRAPA